MNMAEFIKRYGTDGASLFLNHLANTMTDDDDAAEILKDIAQLLQQGLRVIVHG